MDTTKELGGFLAACRRTRLPRHTSPLFVKTLVWMFVVGFALQWIR